MNSYKKYYIFAMKLKLKNLKTMRGTQTNFFTNKFIPMRKYIAACFMLLYIHQMNGQFQVQYIHANPLKFSLEDFNKIQIISANQQSSVRVRYALLDENKKKVCEVLFKLLPLVKGSNTLQYSTGELVWYNSPYRELLLKNQLVSGNFQVCASVTDINETMPEADDCFDVELQSKDIVNDLNLNPIELQSPSHKDTIEETRPLLTWIPPSPTYQGTLYQILLVEKKENQTCTEALNNNLPLVYKKDVLANMLNYPTESPALEKGHKYCWRASAHKNLKEYSRSEDWEFMVRGEESKNQVPHIEDINNRHVNHSVGKKLIISIDNQENSKSVDIIIETIEGKKLSKITITIPYGNSILDLTDKVNLSKGEYKMYINELNNKKYQWRLYIE